MANLLSNPKLHLRKLILVGSRKSYIVHFQKGLNIIYGDSDTGKSSILNLIDYLLGASQVFLYPQLQETGKYCLLEVELNNKIYTIKRDIFSPNKEIEVFAGLIENIDDLFPTKYYPSFRQSGELEHFSDFLLANLGLPNIKIKESPSKADSKMDRMSFRDIFKFCYFNQDQVGSREILNINNYALAPKTREVFKFIFNALDSEITEIQAAIAAAMTKQSELNKKHNTVAFFLRDTDFKSYESLLQTKDDIDVQIEALNIGLKSLNSDMLSNSEIYSDTRAQIVDYDKTLYSMMEEAEVANITLRNNISLKKEYQQDIQKIKASIEILDKVQIPTEHVFPCPICSNDVKVNDIRASFDEYTKADMQTELRTLQKRVLELDTLISQLKASIGDKQTTLDSTKISANNLRNKLDRESKELVSPFVSQVEQLTSQKATLLELKRSTDYHIKIRQTLSELNNQSMVYDSQIYMLRGKLNLLEEESPKIGAILNGLADILRDFLAVIKMKAIYGISISEKTFLPIVRDTDYINLTSGGVRTLVSIGYLLSLLQYSFTNSTNHPGLVMIDTVGKYIGKTSIHYTDTDNASDLSYDIKQGDETKYTEMYKYFLEMSKAKHSHQLIVVDNDLPSSLEEVLKPFIIKHFDENGRNGLPKGFIDDIA
jgi:hypothetical protein